MIKNNSKLIQVSLKRRISDLILRRFFLCENFVQNLVFKLQEEIISVKGRVKDMNRSGAHVRYGHFTRRTQTNRTHSHVYNMYVLLCHTISLSFTLSILISLHYKLEWWNWNEYWTLWVSNCFLITLLKLIEKML